MFASIAGGISTNKTRMLSTPTGATRKGPALLSLRCTSVADSPFTNGSVTSGRICLQSQGRNDRQIWIVLTIRETGQITNRVIQNVFGVSKHQASEDLATLEARHLVERKDTTKRGTRYVLKGAEGAVKGQY